MPSPSDSIPFFRQTIFDPYAMALGRALFAWNDLHENLGLLLCTVMGDMFSDTYLAVWRAPNNDRSQRAILLAVSELLDEKDDPTKGMRECIKWLCDRVMSLEDLRNDIAHAPIMLREKNRLHEAKVIPAARLKHARAMKLAKAGNLLASYETLEMSAHLLGYYAIALIMTAADNPSVTWPERPQLPSRPGPTAK